VEAFALERGRLAQRRRPDRRRGGLSYEQLGGGPDPRRGRHPERGRLQLAKNQDVLVEVDTSRRAVVNLKG